MSNSKTSIDLSASNSSINSSASSKHSVLGSSSGDVLSKMKGLFHRNHHHHHHHQQPRSRSNTNEVPINISEPNSKTPILFLAKRQQSRKITIEHVIPSSPPEAPSLKSNESSSTSLSSATSSITYTFEQESKSFAHYTQQLEEALTILRNLKRDEYESPITLSILRFLENLIHQPKEWISGAKLKLSEMKFPEMAMTLMNSYKEKGYLVRRAVFVNTILLYNSMSNFTDHEFDKEGSIRKQSADAGFIEFACEILNDPSYLESLKKCYTIQKPEDTIQNNDFNNYQKILYICDSALTILYNLANLPELKIHFRECNAMTTIAEYTKLPSNTICIQFPDIPENEECISSLKELQDITSAIRVTSCLLLPLIMNEDEDNLLAANTSVIEVLPILSGMIQMYDRNDQRFYGFSFIELVDGLSKLMVRGRTHKFIDEKLVNLLLKILEKTSKDSSLLECVSNAILNAAFDENVQKLLDTEHAIKVIKEARIKTQSQLVQKNCEAILWTLNRIPHKNSASLSNSCQLQGHIMISYNRSVTAMCLKIRDKLKALGYNVWLDVDNINGGVLESMAKAVENSSIVLICMNEQYKQSYYCRLEAEYATELRKPCIPCLMQPRFRPYGWLGIIKGAKIHVDFATLPFDEAFALLIREIETIKRDTTKSNMETKFPSLSHKPITGFSSSNDDRDKVDSIEPNQQLSTVTNNDGPIADWDAVAVQQWLERSELSHLMDVFSELDGKALVSLQRRKQLSADSYYRLLDRYFERLQPPLMVNVLKFDHELACLFR